jgi:8-oxo-dGTP pyrophosphatase MutT (NUDIX family)
MTYNPYLTEENFFVATKVCLRYRDTILVIEEKRPWKPLWMELPGGKISKNDKDRDIFACLHREVSEELSIDIRFDESRTHLYMAHKSYEHVTFSDVPVPFIFLCYIHECDTLPDIRLSHEHASARWITEGEVSQISHWRPGFDEIVQSAFHYPLL